MRYLLAGASGFLGGALRTHLAEQGHEVMRLVRREPATATEFAWRPDRGELDRAALAGVDVAVNLCGVGVADRPWTRQRRELLRSSRVDPGRTLAEALVGSGVPLLIQASGIAYYGTEPTAEPHTEDAPPASDFLARLVVDWEASAQAAIEAGVRVAWLRTSPVLDRSGGAFAPMRLAWSLGLGATLGDGHQRMPLISLRDYLGVIDWIVTTPGAAGPYNLTLPDPTTNAEFTAALAQELHRPHLLRAPARLLRMALGELAEQLLGDNYALPDRLTQQGYRFADPDVHSAIRSALRRS